TTLEREIAVKNVSLGIFDPSLGIFDPARCRRNPDFWGGFPPKPRSVLRNRQGIPRLSGVSSRARVGCISPQMRPAFVGQQVDVFIAAPSRAAATRSPTSGQIALSPPADARMQIAGGASSTTLASGANQPSH